MISCPCAARDATSRRIPLRMSPSSRMLPPSLTVNRNRLPLEQPKLLFEPVHQVEVLDRLTGRSLDEVVDRREDDRTAAAVGHAPADVAEVRVVDRAQLGQPSGAQHAHEAPPVVALSVLGLELLGADRLM